MDESGRPRHGRRGAGRHVAGRSRHGRRRRTGGRRLLAGALALAGGTAALLGTNGTFGGVPTAYQSSEQSPGQMGGGSGQPARADRESRAARPPAGASAEVGAREPPKPQESATPDAAEPGKAREPDKVREPDTAREPDAARESDTVRGGTGDQTRGGTSGLVQGSTPEEAQGGKPVEAQATSLPDPGDAAGYKADGPSRHTDQRAAEYFRTRWGTRDKAMKRLKDIRTIGGYLRIYTDLPYSAYNSRHAMTLCKRGLEYQRSRGVAHPVVFVQAEFGQNGNPVLANVLGRSDRSCRVTSPRPN
ncbi:hypothetical protein ITP53_31395 [Nonomuraea sp. K274]|uniref:Uncharacterized protein n=1 Tax=Nonomuraea cypriaca TaxID=1187855 RepID=A0A931ADY9_9ACTN|nr:hypothetical protein [Nonomuraea cypriaca]MBF8190153.1 hypothetical protein [Nonomuraea cypriaca]